MRFDKDEFETWRAHLITQRFLDVLVPHWQKIAKDRSMELAWHGNLDLVMHACLRECYDRMEDVRTLRYEDFYQCETLRQE